MTPSPPSRWSLLRSGRTLGLTWEVRILLPVVLFLVLALSGFTVLSYRGAVDRLVEDRRQEAARLARRVAERLAAGEPAGGDTLRRLAPEAVAAAVIDPDGRLLAVTGPLATADPLVALPEDSLREALGVGPGPAAPEVVAGFAPLVIAGRERIVRVDLSASVLAAQLRSLPLLTTLVLTMDGALALLLLLFLRHLLTPYETLLDRARTVGDPEEGRDETAFLLSTFERAVEALERGAEGTDPEGELRTLERTLTASLDSGLLLLDRGGTVLSLNAPGADILDIPVPPAGTPLEEALAERPVMLEVLERAVATRRGLRRKEIRLELGTGGRPLGLSVHPLRRDDGMIHGFLVLFTDLTAAHRAAEEDRLAESLAQLGSLAAGVAHELRNSLATLQGYLGLLERRLTDTESRTDLTEMRREMEHLRRVLEDFLSFARPGTVRAEEVHLLRVAHQAAADPALEGATIEVHHEGGEARIQGDPQLLERAVRNLLHNAVEASRGAPEDEGDDSGAATVDVVVAPLEEGGVEVRVEDRGPGIPQSLRQRLFQPFVSSRAEGVGLGLALSQRIAALHGGRIRLEDRPGGGTRARLQFPLLAGESVTKSNDSEV